LHEERVTGGALEGCLLLTPPFIFPSILLFL